MLNIPFFDYACQCCSASEPWDNQSESHQQSVNNSFMSRTDDSRRIEVTGPSMLSSSEEVVESSENDGADNGQQQSTGERVLPAVTKPPQRAAKRPEREGSKRLIPSHFRQTPKHSDGVSSKGSKTSSENGNSKFRPCFGHAEPQTSETNAGVMQSEVDFRPTFTQQESSV